MLDRPERDILVERVLDLNRDIARQFHRGVPREWLDCDVTMPQLKTLMVLYGMGQATMGDLAVALGTGVSTVTGIVDRLVEHSLVLREEDPRDRRVVVGRPTANGVALIDRLMTAARERTGQVLARLSDDELITVARSAEIVCRAARDLFSPTERGGCPLDPITLGGS